MDLSKVYRKIQNLDSYVNITNELESKREDSSIEVTLDNLKFLKTLHALEVEYFVKYETTGAAHIIFKGILQGASSSVYSSRISEELVSLLKYWIEAVRHCLIKQSNWWKFLRENLILVQKVSNLDRGVRNKLLELTAENLLHLATGKETDIDKKYLILKSVNKCALKSKDEIREQIFGECKNYFNDLSRYMGTCGHMELQLAVLELLVWFLPRHHYPACRAAVAPHWFPKDVYCEAAIEVFMQRSFTYFERDSFDFLDAQNQFTGTVLSALCKKLTIGELVVISEQIKKKHRLNLNIGTRCMTVVLPRVVLASLGVQDSDASSDTDDLLTLAETDVTAVELCGGPDLLIVKVTTLNDPRFIYDGTKKILGRNSSGSCFNVEISITCDRERVHRALLAIFQDKYQTDENTVIEGTQQSLRIKPRRIHQGNAIFRRDILTTTNSNCTASTTSSSLTQFPGKVADNKRVPFNRTFLPISAKPNFFTVSERSEPPSSLLTDSVESSSKITEQINSIDENCIDQSQDKISTYRAQPCSRKSTEFVEQLLLESLNYKHNPRETNERAEFDAISEPVICDVPINEHNTRSCAQTKKGCVIISTDDSSTSNDVSLVDSICEKQINVPKKKKSQKISYPKLDLSKQVRIIIKKITPKDLHINSDVGNVADVSSVNQLENVQYSPAVNRREIQILNETDILGCENIECGTQKKSKTTKQITKAIPKITNSTKMDGDNDTAFSPRRDTINVRKRRRLYSPKDDFQLEEVQEYNVADPSKNKSTISAEIETPRKKRTAKETESKKRTKSTKMKVVSNTAISPRRESIINKNAGRTYSPKDDFQLEEVQESNVADRYKNKSPVSVDYAEVVPRKKRTQKKTEISKLAGVSSELSPRTLRNNRIFDKLMEGVDRTGHVKPINLRSRNINVYNYDSDSDSEERRQKTVTKRRKRKVTPKSKPYTPTEAIIKRGKQAKSQIKTKPTQNNKITTQIAAESEVYNLEQETVKQIPSKRTKRKTRKTKQQIKKPAETAVTYDIEDEIMREMPQESILNTSYGLAAEDLINQDIISTEPNSRIYIEPIVEVITAPDESGLLSPKQIMAPRNKKKLDCNGDTTKDLNITTSPLPSLVIEREVSESDDSLNPAQLEELLKGVLHQPEETETVNVNFSPQISERPDLAASNEGSSRNMTPVSGIVNLEDINLDLVIHNEANVIDAVKDNYAVDIDEMVMTRNKLASSPQIFERPALTESNEGSSRNMTPVSGIVNLEDINLDLVTRNEGNIIDLDEGNTIKTRSVTMEIDRVVTECDALVSKRKDLRLSRESALNLRDAIECDEIFEDQSETLQTKKRFKNSGGTQKPKSKMVRSRRKILHLMDKTDDVRKTEIEKRQVLQKEVEKGLLFDESNLVQTVSPIRLCSSPEIDVDKNESDSPVSLRVVLSRMSVAQRLNPENIAHSPTWKEKEHLGRKDVSRTLEKGLSPQTKDEELIQEMMQKTFSAFEDKLSKVKEDANKRLAETKREMNNTFNSLAVDVRTCMNQLYNNMLGQLQRKTT